MDLARFAIGKRLISAVSTLLILGFGYFAYTTLPRFEDPEFIIRAAQIITEYPGASAEEVADEITETVETAIQQLRGIHEIRSISKPGVSEVEVEFTIAATPDREALARSFTQLRAKIGDIQSGLPPNALASRVYDDFGDVFALYFAITGEGYTLPELHAYAKVLQRDLVTLDGVSKIILSGVQDEVIYVEYEPARLIELGLTPSQIGNLLEGQNLVAPAGSGRAGAIRLAVRPLAAVGSVEAIGDLVITSRGGGVYRLSDIATVRRGLREPASHSLYRNGEPAIGLSVANVLGGNVVEMGERVKDRLEALSSERPIGIDVQPISDQSSSVKTSVDGFVNNVLLALAIVVGTLVVFMGLRSGLLMGIILLVSVAGTLVGMYLFGLDLQRISLGALIIALGMLVDNAIVVVEGTLVRVQRGEDTASAAVSVVNQTRWPLLGGTIVGLLAFSPIGLSPDNTGEYAGSLFWTITIALLFSWLVAIWLVPYYCTLFLKPGGEHGEVRKPAPLRLYSTLLERAIRFRYVTVAVVIGLLVSAIALFSAVPPGFFPASTRAQFVLDFSLAEGTDIKETKARIGEIDEYVRGIPGVTSTSTAVGGGHSRFMLTYQGESRNSAYGQILIDVEDFDLIDDMVPGIQAWLDRTYPEARGKVWKFVLGPGGGSRIEARFYGPEPTVLRRLAEDAAAIMDAAGAVAGKVDWREPVPVIRPVIDTENARRLGLTQGEISHALREHLSGTVIGVYREGDMLTDIVMRPLGQARSDLAKLREAQVFSEVSGGYVPISQVVSDFGLDFELGVLRRINRELAITAQSDNAPGVRSGELFNAVRGDIEALDLPPGYRLEWRGEFGNSMDANAGLAATFPFGFGAMIIVVLLLFNAVRQPVIIWLTVPLALIGVIYGMAATQTPMEFMSILGILSLTGMLVKNAIVLIDEMDSQIDGGKARMTAITDAAASRFRPVLLGVGTTVLGVIPLLWDPFFNSLAVTIICGLSFASVLTLVIVPVLYAIFFRVKGGEVAVVG